MATIPDSTTLHGQTIADEAIRKHFRPGNSGVTYHFFRREHREIVDYYLKGTLPTVEGDQPREDDSAQWHFRLRDEKGRDLLRSGRPMKRKSRVPKPAIDQLEAKLNHFAAVAARGNPATRDLIKHFRLPDPELQPELYRLVGPKWKPQLTFLWGFDFPKDNNRCVLPSEAIACLRKRECHPFLPVFYHLIFVPLMALSLLLAAVVYAPRGYEWAKLKLDSKEQGQIAADLQNVHVPEFGRLEDAVSNTLKEALSKYEEQGSTLKDAENRKREGRGTEQFRANLENFEAFWKKSFEFHRDSVKKRSSLANTLVELSSRYLSPANIEVVGQVRKRVDALDPKLADIESTLAKIKLANSQLDLLIRSEIDGKTRLARLNNELARVRLDEKDFRDSDGAFGLDDPEAILVGSNELTKLFSNRLSAFEAMVENLSIDEVKNSRGDSQLNGLVQDLAAQYELITKKQKKHLEYLQLEKQKSVSFFETELLNKRIEEVKSQLTRWEKLWREAGLLRASLK